MPRFRVRTAFSVSNLLALSVLTSGCLPSARNHYVKSAQTNMSTIPLVPAVLPAGENGKIGVALRAGYRGPTRTDFETRPVVYAKPDPGAEGFRGDYAIRQGQYSVGGELREKAFDIFDWYLTAGANFGTGNRVAGLLGLGFTIPFPQLYIRLSPALGIHGYTNFVSDSVITHAETLWGVPYTDTSTHVIENRAMRLGPVGSFTVSAWPPNTSGRAWTPYVQYQANWIGMGAKDENITVTAPSEILVLHTRIVAVGMEYAPAPRITWNIRLAGEYLWNRQDAAWGYRAETGLGLRFDP